MGKTRFPLVGSKLQVWGRNPPADGVEGNTGGNPCSQIQRVFLVFPTSACRKYVSVVLKQGRFFVKTSTEGRVLKSVMVIFLCRKRYFYCPM